MSKKLKKKIFIWSPMLSNVGTIKAMTGIADSLKKYLNCDVKYINILGEFSNYDTLDYPNINFLKIDHLIPNTGKFSKYLILFISILSLPFLIIQILKQKPDIILTGLVGFIPGILKFFFSELKIVNSIQGYPKFNFLRKFIWKVFYKRSDFLITMTNQTKLDLQKSLSFNENKIYVIQNPVISSNIKILSKKKIDDKEKFIFEKDVYCAIGRLTYQKNFIELLKFLNHNNLENNNFNLIIIGEGESKNDLQDYILKNKLTNCYLLGFKKNPYKYLAKSRLYISTSLWEEPGHTLLEAGYLNIPILSSNCPNGPNEIIKNNYNGFKYEMGNKTDFLKKLNEFNNLDDLKKKKMLINMKKNVINYTQFRFCKNFSKILNLI